MDWPIQQCTNLRRDRRTRAPYRGAVRAAGRKGEGTLLRTRVSATRRCARRCRDNRTTMPVHAIRLNGSDTELHEREYPRVGPAALCAPLSAWPPRAQAHAVKNCTATQLLGSARVASAGRPWSGRGRLTLRLSCSRSIRVWLHGGTPTSDVAMGLIDDLAGSTGARQLTMR